MPVILGDLRVVAADNCCYSDLASFNGIQQWVQTTPRAFSMALHWSLPYIPFPHQEPGSDPYSCGSYQQPFSLSGERYQCSLLTEGHVIHPRKRALGDVGSLWCDSIWLPGSRQA